MYIKIYNLLLNSINKKTTYPDTKLSFTETRLLLYVI